MSILAFPRMIIYTVELITFRTTHHYVLFVANPNVDPLTLFINIDFGDEPRGLEPKYLGEKYFIIHIQKILNHNI